jgi:hypothetical protein
MQAPWDARCPHGSNRAAPNLIDRYRDWAASGRSLVQVAAGGWRQTHPAAAPN